MTVVLDASALLAVLLDEQGSQNVIPVMRGSLMSAVNASECFSRAIDKGYSASIPTQLLRQFDITIMPFGLKQAAMTAELRQHKSSVGASLGDRAFLALAIEHQANALTGDRRLAALDIGVDIQLIR